MKIRNRLLTQWFLVFITIFLVSCAGDESDLPPERPAGTVSGSIIDSAISGARVNVYSFANGTRGARLGGGTTDVNGNFSVQVRADSQLVLVEATGGRYIEEASGAQITLNDGERISAITNYVDQGSVNVIVTPLTHMGTALAEFKIAEGMTVAAAVDDAYLEIDTFFALTTRGTQSVNIAVENPDLETLSTEARYGFYLAGLSHWSAWVSQQSGLDPHTNLTSIGFAQLAYNDVKHDGLLNGVGFDDNNEPLNLSFGNVSIEATQYRYMFSIHAIAVGRGVNNKTGIDVTTDAIREQLARLAETPQDELPPLLPQDADPVNITTLPLTVDVAESEWSGFYSQQYSFDILVTSIVGFENIRVYIDNNPLNQPNLQPDYEIPYNAVPRAILEIGGLPSNSYTIYVVVTDLFDGSAMTSFTARFDNDAPTITFDTFGETSFYLTNQTTETITGGFDDNLAGVEQILVNGVVAELTYTPNTENRVGDWTVDIQGLNSGPNDLNVELIDFAGNSVTLPNPPQIYLDDIDPVIDVNAGHSRAKFSTVNGYDQMPLQSVNDIASPLYIETNKLNYNGTIDPADTSLLDPPDIPPGSTEVNIPFFRFTISDERMQGVNADPQQDLDITIKYARPNGSVPLPLPAQNNVTHYSVCDVDSCDFIVPLTSPSLPTDWDQANPSDQHVIEVSVSDGANTATEQFSFYADFHVASLCAQPDLCNQSEIEVTDLDPFSIYDGTPAFESRGLIYGQDVETMNYTFTNTTGSSIYISLNDDSAHTVIQVYDEEIRQHKYHLKRTYQWRLGLVDPTPDNFDVNCPTVFTPSPTSWTIVSFPDSIQNFNPGWSTDFTEEDQEYYWQPIQVPQTFGEELTIDSDTLPANPPLLEPNWGSAPDIDEFFQPGSVVTNFPFRQLTYNADYSLNFGGTVAGISNWVVVNGGGSTVNSCQNQRNFEQREVLAEYESLLLYPQDIASVVTLDNLPPFGTDNTLTLVRDNTLDSDVTPINGWHRIPAGNSVTVTKVINVPQLDINEADLSQDALYITPDRRDSSITWSVSRNMNIQMIHDAGEINVGEMSQLDLRSNTGIKEYVIDRQ